MTNLLVMIFSITLIFGLASCGKRGELLPPSDYQAPSE